MPEIPRKGSESDSFFIELEEPEQITATLVDMVKKRIPAKFHCYIHSRSEADFTHGFCPECIEQHYGIKNLHPIR
jgi:inhibitor of KinA sporulation pathway (predicted exonuclease)